MTPLEDTLEQLSSNDEVDIHLARAGWPPSGDGWFVLSDIMEKPGILRSWVDELLDGAACGRRDVAGSYLASWLTGPAAGTAAGALISVRRTWPLDPGSIAVHRHAEGWFDRVALRSPAVWVLAGDPAAGDPDSIVCEDLSELRSRLAGQVVGLVEPVFAIIRAETRYPVRSMWGSLADGIAGMALWRDLRSRVRSVDTWEQAAGFLDRLAERTRLLKARPELSEVPWSGGTARLAVKGTCCLYFKTFDGEPDTCGEGYCISCPFRTDSSRRQRWADWLPQVLQQNDPVGGRT